MADEEKKRSSRRLSDRQSQRRRLKGIATGIAAWFQVLDDESGRFYFYNQKTKETAWGLPLRDSVPASEIRPHAKHGNDDWVCCIDAGSGRKFFQSEKYGKIQWQLPLLYRPTLSKLAYFAERRTSMAGASVVEASSSAKTSRPHLLKRQMSMATMISHISIAAVLEQSICCSAFHRYLVSVHAEENLLFWAACEVFRVGNWKGMQVLGVAAGGTGTTDAAEGSAASDAVLRARARAAAAAQVRAAAAASIDAEDDEEDEGTAQLREQLSETRASVRIGMSLGQSLDHEARVIFEKFIVKGAPLEIFIDSAEADRIRAKMEKGEVGRDLFVSAQAAVLRNMEVDVLPRFLRVALATQPESVGSGILAFTPDEVVQRALQQLAHSAGAEDDEDGDDDE